MTRYARARGSKSCNSRAPSSATPWYLLKDQISHEKNSEPVNIAVISIAVKSSEISSDTVRSSCADWYNFGNSSEKKRKRNIPQKPNYKSKTERKMEGSSSVVSENVTECRLSKYKSESILFSDASDRRTSGKVIRENKEVTTVECPASEETNKTTFKKREKKRSVEVEPSKSKKRDANEKISCKAQQLRGKNIDDIRALRRAEKSIKREKKKVCFCCRRWGHQISECPEFNKDKKLNLIISSGSFCYNCGSTEHKMSQCMKTGKKALKFACCFVCGEEGHIARLCPDNSKGLYPMGGSCLFCGAVDHLRADCHRADQVRDTEESSLVQLSSGPIESIPEDLQKTSTSPSSKRVIQF